MNKPALVSAIEKAIGLLEQVYRDGADESDLYEASLLTVAVAAARSAGGTVLLTADGHNRAREIRFRRSPGSLWTGAFTYALVSFPNSVKQLEIHLGVFVRGTSLVAHECDIAIIDHGEAERSRRGAVHPRKQGLIAAIEAKHYSASPGIGVGRAFLGLGTELGQKQCSLGFPATSSSTLAALIASRPSETYDELLPGTGSARRLEASLEQSIRNWKARISR
jgi:hypothetical protein